MLHRLTIDAFHASPETAQALERLREDRLFAKSKVTLHAGGLAAAAGHYHATPTPQLVVVEDCGDQAALVEGLARLAEVCVTGTRVVVIGRVNDIACYRLLMSQGVSDYLVGPIGAGQLAGAIEALFADPDAAPRGRMICCFGARGGVGSSTIAHNLAWLLASQPGGEVILLDMDLSFGTAGLAFNVDPRQTVGELMGEAERIDTQLLERMLVKAEERLHLLPAAAELRPWPPIEVETVERLFDQARRMASVLVVDLPHTWAPWIAHALESADEVVLTAAPDLANLRDVKALLEALATGRTDKPAPRLVLNKQDNGRRNQLTPRDFADTLKVPLAAVLACDPVVVEAANNAKMLGEVAKTHKLTEALAELARLVGGRAAPPKPPASPVAAWLKKAGLGR